MVTWKSHSVHHSLTLCVTEVEHFVNLSCILIASKASWNKCPWLAGKESVLRWFPILLVVEVCYLLVTVPLPLKENLIWGNNNCKINLCSFVKKCCLSKDPCQLNRQCRIWISKAASNCQHWVFKIFPWCTVVYVSKFYIACLSAKLCLLKSCL